MQTQRTTGDVRPSSLVSTGTERRSNASRTFRRARALAWFSVGLGLAELLAPRALARLIGVPDTRRTRAILRGCGVRELAAGATLFVERKPWLGLWSRAIGDAIDVALLGVAFASPRSRRGRTLAVAAAVAPIVLLDCATTADA